MLLHIPHIHGTAHHPKDVVSFQGRDRIALVEFDRGPVDTVLAKKVAQAAGMFAIDVLEDEQSHEPGQDLAGL